MSKENFFLLSLCGTLYTEPIWLLPKYRNFYLPKLQAIIYCTSLQVDFLYSSSVVTVVPRQQVILDKTGCTPPTPTPTQPGSPFTAARVPAKRQLLIQASSSHAQLKMAARVWRTTVWITGWTNHYSVHLTAFNSVFQCIDLLALHTFSFTPSCDSFTCTQPIPSTTGIVVWFVMFLL